MAMRRPRRIALIGGAVVLVVLVGALLVLSVLFDSSRIPATRMQPTLEVGDRVLSRSVEGKEVSYGDVVVFHAPNGGKGSVDRISRVVAMGGDRVTSAAGHLVVNGQRVEEHFLPAGTKTNGIAPIVVPPGQLYLLNDDRSSQPDSRTFGALPRDKVFGLLLWTWWPLSHFGGL